MTAFCAVSLQNRKPKSPTCALRPTALTKHTNQATLCLCHKIDAFQRAPR